MCVYIYIYITNIYIHRYLLGAEVVLPDPALRAVHLGQTIGYVLLNYDVCIYTYIYIYT